MAKIANLKMRPEHYWMLNDAIAKLLVSHPQRTTWEGNIEGWLQFYKDRRLSEKRARWDLLWGSRGYLPKNWVIDTLYPYINDDHIDSALRHIVLELRKAKSPPIKTHYCRRRARKNPKQGDTYYTYTLKPTHISRVRAGDVILHDGKLRTLNESYIKQGGFMGKTIWGDCYRLGQKPVMVWVKTKKNPSNKKWTVAPHWFYVDRDPQGNGYRIETFGSGNHPKSVYWYKTFKDLKNAVNKFVADGYENMSKNWKEEVKRRNPRKNPPALPSLVIPAYGRDFKSAKDAKANWLSGKDWINADSFSPWYGKPISVRDFPPGSSVNLRFCRNTKVTVVKHA